MSQVIEKNGKAIFLNDLSAVQKLAKHKKLYALVTTLVSAVVGAQLLGAEVFGHMVSEQTADYVIQGVIALIGVGYTFLVKEFPDLSGMVDVIEDILERVQDAKWEAGE